MNQNLQKVKQELYKLESLKPGTEEYHSLIERMMATLHQHNDDEEVKDLPLLEPALGTDASKKAASSFRRTKKFVPTRYALCLRSKLHLTVLLCRAHPGIPNKPPIETIEAFLEAPIDKLRDMFAQFPTEEEKADAKRELKHREHDANAGREAQA